MKGFGKRGQLPEFVVSASGVKVWTKPEAHPLLKGTDLRHPALLDKLSETYSRGAVKGLPRICSENSEDACTWFHFSPLLNDRRRRRSLLTRLLRDGFPRIPKKIIDGAGDAELCFWPKVSPPPSRRQREGRSEPDLLIKFDNRALVLVEAKYKSCISSKTTYDPNRDQIIRLMDVGSWKARESNVDSCYVIALQYGDALTNVESGVNRYASNPLAIRGAIPYRSDLSDKDFETLSRSVAFVRWDEPYPAGR